MSRLYLSKPCALPSALLAHGAAGAVGAWLSLRPLFGRGPPRSQNPGKPCRGNETACMNAPLRRSELVRSSLTQVRPSHAKPRSLRSSPCLEQAPLWLPFALDGTQSADAV